MIDSTPPSFPAVNPYAPPKAEITPGVELSGDAERIRRELLGHEASIQSIGSLYLLGAVGAGLGTMAFTVMLIAGGMAGEAGTGLLMTLLFGFLTWVYWALGRGLRNLDAGIRIWATILAVIGLLGFPLGTLINAYILYLLHGAKGKRVMTPEYQAVVQQTPHIKYKTPLWLKILLLSIITLFVLAMLMAARG